MNRFCVKCGARNNENDRFCGECGAPVISEAADNTLAHDPVKSPRLPRTSMRGMLWLVSVIVLLCIAGVAAVFLSGPSGPPQAAALGKLFNANENFVKRHTCLDNFNYNANAVDVSTWSKSTQNWLQVLVDGGIYNPPETIARTSIFGQDFLRYTQTDKAKVQVKGKLLCFAKGVTVDSVIYHDVRESDGIRYVLGTAKYHYASPVAWTSSAGAQAQMPQLFGTDSHEIEIALIAGKDSEWQLTSADKIAALEVRNLLSTNNKVEQDSAFSFSHFFSNLFPANPASKLMGKWVANVAFISVDLELRPDTIIFMNQETSVTYESRGKDIFVKTPDAGPDLLITPISSNEIMMGWQGVNLHFRRIQ